MNESSMEEIADGMALWREAKPQTKEDWIAIARRFYESESELQARLDAATEVVEAARAAMDEPLGVLVSAEAEDQEEIARNYGTELARLSAALAVFDELARSGTDT